MAEITDRTAPAYVPTTNALDAIPDDALGGPAEPAYLKFGISNAPMEKPPSVGDTEVFLVRVRCTGVHGPLERKDGEMRHERSLAIQAVWRQGEKEPEPEKTAAELEAEAAAEAAKNQPPLYDENGEPHDPDVQQHEPSGLDEFDPEFSHNDGGGR